MMQLNFLKNIRSDVINFDKLNRRIKLEWIYPYCIGIPDNRMDEVTKNKVSARHNRIMFIKLIKAISRQIETPF